MFLTLNHLIRTDKQIDAIIAYLSTLDKLSIKPKPIKAFIRNSELFYLREGKLYVKEWDMEALKEADKEANLKLLYEEDNFGLGTSVVKFYKHVRNEFLGITRNDISKFLNKQSVYQITKPIKARVNMPIVASAKAANSIWAIDLIDMEYNLGPDNPKKLPKYIQTIVDVFSGRVWLRFVITNSALQTQLALKKVIDEYKVSPKYIIIDNGVEYKGIFETYCKEQNIKIRRSRTYSPESNPSERYNQMVRKTLRSFLLKYKTQDYDRFVANTERNINDSFILNKKATPNMLWSPTKSDDIGKKSDIIENLGIIPLEELKKSLIAKLQIKNANKIADFKTHNEYETGDLVRVAMSSLYSNVRRLNKEGRGKLVVVRYSPQVFRISNESKKRTGLPSRQKYSLETLDGVKSFYKPTLEKEKNLAKRKVKYQKYTFWGKELQQVSKEERTKKYMSLSEAMKLNKLSIITTGDLRDVILKPIPFKNRNQFYEEEIVEDDEPAAVAEPAPVPPPPIAPPAVETRKGTRIRKGTEKIKATALEKSLSTALGKSSRRKKKQ
jgi:hypothetical protein